ncbi:hypothetical protein KXS11_10525 [Plantibacter flavus]|uniref:hypothetical protein n=1 Tax=Plantibacter flavus TaxID=150123 RepID=UPI003F13BDED
MKVNKDSRLLRGISGRALLTVFWVLCVLMGLYVVVFIPVMVALRQYVPTFLTGVSLVLAGGVMVLLASRRFPAELRRGYTTSLIGHTHVDQIDPRSGQVIRRAGEPLLPRAERRAREREARREVR